tara:strand:+ start:1366 stop:2460 length:1095 start_codon:yes stop_codon:yes gene_type:complete
VAEEQKDSKIGAFFKSILPSEETVGELLYTKGELDLKKLGGFLGAGAGALGLFDRNMPTVGYQGSIPEYTAVRKPVSFTDDLNRRPGSGGRRYFSDVIYAPEGDTSAAETTAKEQALGLQALNLANPFRQDKPASVIPDKSETQGIATATDRSAKPMPDADELYNFLTAQDLLDAAIEKGLIQPKTETQQLADNAASIMANTPYSGGSVSPTNVSVGPIVAVDPPRAETTQGIVASSPYNTMQDEPFFYQTHGDPMPPKYERIDYGYGPDFAAGGIARLHKGRYLDGSTDGMADEVPAMIDNEQPAALSDGEFVIPADVVSHLGNGNSDAGAKELETMMDKVRMARTGTKKQAPAIDPEKFLPT